MIEFLWQTNEKSADYSFNKQPRRLLRADRLPHRLAEGQLPGRVHGGADLLGDVDQGQGAVLRGALRGDGDRDPAARRQPLRPRVHGRRAATSASAWTPSRASATRRSRRSSARARRAAQFTSLWDFCERVDSRAVNKKAIEALIKCGAFGSTGATPQGHARGARAGAGRRPEGPAGRADRPGLDLRPRRSDGAQRRGRPAPRRRRSLRPMHPPISDRGVRPARAAGGREGGDRPVHLRAPAEAAARGAARARRLPAGGARRPPRQGLGDGRRDHHRGASGSARATAIT